MTLASVVMAAGMRRPKRAFRSAWLSTSPFSTAATYGPGDPPSSSWLTGWALGSEMMPTLAQRVWASTVTRADGDPSARWSSPSSRMAARSAAVLSPSSPISAAAL